MTGNGFYTGYWTIMGRNDMAEEKAEITSAKSQDEINNHIRILYLYQLLLTESDQDHMLSTSQIREKMQEYHGIYMHRTTVPSDISMLKAAGIEIISVRTKWWNYYMEDRTFSVPELKLLIDAVQSSKFITEKKSKVLIDKLTTLTSRTRADELKRSVHISGRAKSDNEKGYYIIDVVNEAINSGVKIAFEYFDYDGKKKHVLKNDGKPYKVSPYDLIWDGDYYYLTGFCDDRDEVRVFRVDRIENSPVLLKEEAVKQPKDYKVDRYTQEVFRMFATDEVTEVILDCDNDAMKAVIDHFGNGARTKAVGKDRFQAKVKVCTGPTFFRWVFGWEGKIVIREPEEIREAYRKMLEGALENYL